MFSFQEKFNEIAINSTAILTPFCEISQQFDYVFNDEVLSIETTFEQFASGLDWDSIYCPLIILLSSVLLTWFFFFALRVKSWCLEEGAFFLSSLSFRALRRNYLMSFDYDNFDKIFLALSMKGNVDLRIIALTPFNDRNIVKTSKFILFLREIWQTYSDDIEFGEQIAAIVFGNYNGIVWTDHFTDDVMENKNLDATISDWKSLITKMILDVMTKETTS